MDCGQAAFKMQEFLDQALGAEEAELLRAHLAACAACGRAFRTLAAVQWVVASREERNS